MIDHDQIRGWVARNRHLRPMAWAELALLPLTSDDQREAGAFSDAWDIADVVTVCRATGVETLVELEKVLDFAEPWAAERLTDLGVAARSAAGRPVAVSPLDATVFVLLMASRRGPATVDLLRYADHIRVALASVLQGTEPPLIDEPVLPPWAP